LILDTGYWILDTGYWILDVWVVGVVGEVLVTSGRWGLGEGVGVILSGVEV
jgi:hypothetical protein